MEGPSLVSALEWHDEVTSTNMLALDAARRGVPEVYAILADRQTVGRGRRGRTWEAPRGTSLLLSLVVRPTVRPVDLPLLPLLTGLALLEAVKPSCPGTEVGLKWPNDLLVADRKAAGILVEAPVQGAAVIGIGLNVDWRAAERPETLREGSISLAEALPPGLPAPDRWRILAALLGVFSNRYQEWQRRPVAFLEGYRQRCTTLGQQVRIQRAGTEPLEGKAVGVGEDGALEVRQDGSAVVRCAAGAVEHLRLA
ncbi:MAG: biotin--[acetyl-CoA-carboxylase] ligase [Nitriliruptorales bacterium]|nr:biotin--[acetyl-CoA-carboxylase] ligase [Nitriliruptorales bacterium]